MTGNMSLLCSRAVASLILFSVLCHDDIRCSLVSRNVGTLNKTLNMSHSLSFFLWCFGCSTVRGSPVLVCFNRVAGVDGSRPL